MLHGVRESHPASYDYFSLLLVPLHVNCSVRRGRRSWKSQTADPDVSGPTFLIIPDPRPLRSARFNASLAAEALAKEATFQRFTIQRGTADEAIFSETLSVFSFVVSDEQH